MFHTRPCVPASTSSSGCTECSNPRSTRTKYARPKLDPSLCDSCYWDFHGQNMQSIEPQPLGSLVCLCTRRENLDLLLVSRQIHHEASYIFWTENVFAFENHGTLIGFLSVVREHIREWIRYISFMPDEVCEIAWMDFGLVWEYLRMCTGLIVFEIDVMLLDSLENVLGLGSLNFNRRVDFVKRSVGTSQGGWPDIYVCLSRGGRKAVCTPLTKTLNQVMTGIGSDPRLLENAYCAIREEMTDKP
ncbi:unnamed protein product [Penicillium salamii]|uniref:Uncharacterized protein n=1 Tax=Penicillium salamii TaxID=1612424 RepID=A0A9W4J5T7_9EURO|nr:unnamed protein product [Penicillium salamii]CAG8224860.1 unnamed protein product [Penicillium salamii]CAG8290025.1 unnamed protein product [Penicillium salamii]CAG8319053.1 unnamed protein product [Penicillium salamii]CAG8331569.1 unnamed protein product [Penicillium salamii]